MLKPKGDSAPLAQPVLVCLFGAGARGFGEPSSCFTQTCQVSGSSWQHSPKSRRSTSQLINIIQSRQLKQLLSERRGQGDWEMNPWHFRQLPLLLFLTHLPLAVHFKTSAPPVCQGHTMGAHPPQQCPSPHRAGAPGTLGVPGPGRGAAGPLTPPPLCLLAARWERGRLITTLVRRENVSSVGFLFLFGFFFPLFKSLTAFISPHNHPDYPPSPCPDYPPLPAPCPNYPLPPCHVPTAQFAQTPSVRVPIPPGLPKSRADASLRTHQS